MWLQPNQLIICVGACIVLVILYSLFTYKHVCSYIHNYINIDGFESLGPQLGPSLLPDVCDGCWAKCVYNTSSANSRRKRAGRRRSTSLLYGRSCWKCTKLQNGFSNSCWKFRGRSCHQWLFVAVASASLPSSHGTSVRCGPHLRKR